ncbi:MAG: hypothetical protein ACXVBJ_13210 [Flavisolibacter sp.]
MTRRRFDDKEDARRNCDRDNNKNGQRPKDYNFMIPHKKGIPSERIDLPEDVQRGFYALGMNPSYVKRYLFACLQAVANLARPRESANAFITTPPFNATRWYSHARHDGGYL